MDAALRSLSTALSHHPGDAGIQAPYDAPDTTSPAASTASDSDLADAVEIDALTQLLSAAGVPVAPPLGDHGSQAEPSLPTPTSDSVTANPEFAPSATGGGFSMPSMTTGEFCELTSTVIIDGLSNAPPGTFTTLGTMSVAYGFAAGPAVGVWLDGVSGFLSESEPAANLATDGLTALCNAGFDFAEAAWDNPPGIDWSSSSDTNQSATAWDAGETGNADFEASGGGDGTTFSDSELGGMADSGSVADTWTGDGGGFSGGGASGSWDSSSDTGTTDSSWSGGGTDWGPVGTGESWTDFGSSYDSSWSGANSPGFENNSNGGWGTNESAGPANGSAGDNRTGNGGD